MSSEEKGEIIDGPFFLSAEDHVMFTLKNHPQANEISAKYNMPEVYFRSLSSLPVSVIKKIVKTKFGLSKDHVIEIAVGNELLPDYYSLIDVAYIYPRSARSGVCAQIYCFIYLS